MKPCNISIVYPAYRKTLRQKTQGKDKSNLLRANLARGRLDYSSCSPPRGSFALQQGEGRETTASLIRSIPLTSQHLCLSYLPLSLTVLCVLTCPFWSMLLLVSLTLLNVTSLFIQWAPLVGLSGCTYSLYNYTIQIERCCYITVDSETPASGNGNSTNMPHKDPV